MADVLQYHGRPGAERAHVERGRLIRWLSGERLEVLAAAAWVWIGSIVGAGLGFLVQLIIARTLDPAGFGQFSIVFVAANLLGPITVFGLNHLWLQVFGEEGEAAFRWVAPSLRLGLAGALVGVLSFALWVVWVGEGPRLLVLAVLLVPFLLARPVTELVSAIHQLEEDYGLLALWRSLRGVLVFAGVVVVAATTPSLIAYGGAFAVGGGVLIAVGGRDIRRFVKASRERGSVGSPVSVTSVFTRAIPFTTYNVLYLVILQSDILVLGAMVDEAAVGAYSAAFVVLSGLLVLPNVVHRKILSPRLYRLVHSDHGAFRRTVLESGGVITVAGLLIALAVFAGAEPLVGLLFGPDYLHTAVLLTALAPMLIFRFAAVGLECALLARPELSRLLLLQLVTAVMNVVLNIWLVGRMGALGAARATVISEAVLLAGLLMLLRSVLLPPRR